MHKPANDNKTRITQEHDYVVNECRKRLFQEQLAAFLLTINNRMVKL